MGKASARDMGSISALAIAAEMLAAGAPYFDREIKEEEVDVYKPLPEGHVNVGTPQVVDGPKVK